MPHSVASPGADDAPAPELAAGADVEMTVDTAETDGPEQNNDKPVKSEDKPDVKLEDLFADVDSDDDDQLPPSSRPDGSKPGSSSPPHQPPTLAAQGALEASDPEVMRMFYQRLFPWRNFFQWLNHSPTTTNDFAHREFAFTLPSDIMLRYLSYPTADLYVSPETPPTTILESRLTPSQDSVKTFSSSSPSASRSAPFTPPTPATARRCATRLPSSPWPRSYASIST